MIVRLGAMMFLQFFIWGAWFVSSGVYLPSLTTDDANLTANAYSVSYLAAAFAPLFFGFIADRYLPAQIVLAGLHLIGAGFMYGTYSAIEAGEYGLIVPLIFGHMCCFAPTLGLTNAVAFNALKDTEKQFPVVRVFGTVGWIVAGWVVAGSILGWVDFGYSLERLPDQYLATAIAGVALAVYSLTLPNTPPRAKGEPFSFGKLFGADAWPLLKDRSFLTFLVCTVLVVLPLSLYYSTAANFIGQAGIDNPTSTMTLGQVSEVGFMLAMAFLIARLGIKWMLLIGMFSWVLRYGLFAAAWPGDVAWMLYLGILLHGICYDFFFVTGQIYVDRVARPEIRSQAQSLLVLATYGIGFTVGTYLGGPYTNAYTDATAAADLKAAQAEYAALAEEDAEGEAALAVEARIKAIDTVDWRPFWMWPAAFAGGVGLVFLAVFREPRRHQAGAAETAVAGQPAAEVGTAEPA